MQVGEKSLQGRGGMGAKVDAAISAVGGGVQAVIIAAGGDRDIIDDIMTGTCWVWHLLIVTDIVRCGAPHCYWTISTLNAVDSFLSFIPFLPHSFHPSSHSPSFPPSILLPSFFHPYLRYTGKKAGTLFLGNSDATETEPGSAAAPASGSPSTIPVDKDSSVPVPVKVEEIARGARAGSRKLQDLKSEERSAILTNIALALEKRENEILQVNLLDIEAAEKRYWNELYTRLRLMPENPKIWYEKLR
jgi:hypothetical protein